MSIIRGKVEHDREFKPNTSTQGKSPFYKAPCGHWIDMKTGKHIDVKETTLGELMDEVLKCSKESNDEKTKN